MVREPMNPKAGVPGPGPFAVRDDQLNMGSTSYGDGKDIKAIKSGAKLSKTPDVQPASAAGVRDAALSQVTPLFAPSQRPNEDITSGAAVNSSTPGPEALMMNQAAQRDKDIVAKYKPILETMAALPDTPESFRIFVRYVQGDLG